MKIKILLAIFAIIVVIASMLSFGGVTGSADNQTQGNQTLNDTGISSIQNQTFVVASEDSVLGRYEHSNRTFEKFAFNDGVTVYWHQRMIGDIVVEQDFINYQVDTRTGALLGNPTHWRDNLTESTPNITVTKEQAEDIAGGGEASLFYIDPNSAVFSAIQPVPQDPCWVVCKRDSNNTLYNITVIDVQSGTILGYGFPPPSPSFVYLGPAIRGGNCSDDIFWPVWYENAQQWFKTMGYSPTNITWPTTNDIKNIIQNPDTTLFYGIAHGNGYSIGCGCNQSYLAPDIKNWLQNYPPIPFVFLQSCDSMAGYNTPGTFGYEFRKGLSVGAVVVGHIGLGQANLTDWSATSPWQDNFFSSMANGSTVGEAYTRANYVFPNCAPYVVFAGDSNLKLVPKISRITSHSIIAGETRDVNAGLLPSVSVGIYKEGSSLLASANSNPNFSVTVNGTGKCWLLATKDKYYGINMTDMTMLPPYYINLWGERYVFDFEGDYGLVPRACNITYALTSINHWLFPPSGHPEWGISDWKAMESVHSWQFPR